MKAISVLFFSLLARAAIAQEVQQPAAGSPARKAIMDGLRENEVVRRLSAEWKEKVIFTHVAVRKFNDWAWVVASPQTEDGKHIVEPLTSVMHAKGGHWQVVEYISDESRAGRQSGNGLSRVASAIHGPASRLSGRDFS